MEHYPKANIENKNQIILFILISSTISGARICEYLESIRQTNESGATSVARTPPIQMNSPNGPNGATGKILH